MKEEDQDQEELTSFDQEASLDSSLYDLKVSLSAWDSSMLFFLSRKGYLTPTQLEGIQSNLEELSDLLRPILRNPYYTDEVLRIMRSILDQINQGLKVSPRETLEPMLKLKMAIETYLVQKGVYYPTQPEGKEGEYGYPYQGKGKEDYTKLTPRERFPKLLQEELEKILRPEELRQVEVEREVIHGEVLRSALLGRIPSYEDLGLRQKTSPIKVEEAATERLKELQGRKEESLRSEDSGVIQSRLWSYQPLDQEMKKFMEHQQEAKTTEHLSKVRTRPVPKTKLEDTAEKIIQEGRKRL